MPVERTNKRALPSIYSDGVNVGSTLRALKHIKDVLERLDPGTLKADPGDPEYTADAERMNSDIQVAYDDLDVMIKCVAGDNEVAYKDDNVVVRVTLDDVKSEYFVKAHPIMANGAEGQPRGYMLGSNSLLFKVRPT